MEQGWAAATIREPPHPTSFGGHLLPRGEKERAKPLDPFNHSFSIMVEVDAQEELDRLWDALGEGGGIEQCGWLKDRWGLCWQIAPKRLGELMTDPDPAVVRRVTEQMLKLVKLDFAPLEAAAKG